MNKEFQRAHNFGVATTQAYLQQCNAEPKKCAETISRDECFSEFGKNAKMLQVCYDAVTRQII